MNSSKYRLFPSLVNLYHSLHIPLRKIVNQSSMFCPGGILDPEISVSELLFSFLTNRAVGRTQPTVQQAKPKRRAMEGTVEKGCLVMRIHVMQVLP